MKVDITESNSLPIYNSLLLREYCELDERVRPLACSVKRFAKAAGVVGAASQNLSSYAWSLLVLFYLQAADLKLYCVSANQNMPCLQSGAKQDFELHECIVNVGFKAAKDIKATCCGMDACSPWRELLSGFFRFYSCDFDLDRTVISVRRGAGHATEGSGPHIEDPFDGRQLGAVLTPERRKAFKDALHRGRAMVEDGTLTQLLEGDADLCSQVKWETFLDSEDLLHHCVRPAGLTSGGNPSGASKSGEADAFQAQGGYPLDEYQRRAMCAMAQGDSAVVAAPTSAGKTLVADFVLSQAIQMHRSAIFCSPTKALSNQKFVDFQDLFPQQVGLLTGDASIARSSPLLVVTTEVLLTSCIYR